jgi:hypothetical protein
MLLWLVLGIGGPIYMGYGGNAIHIGGNLLLFAIIAVLGWKVFGKPVTDA